MEKRMQILIDELVMTPNEFASFIHVSPDTVYNILKNKTAVTPFVKKKIYEAMPQLSRVWFETGTGERFNWKPSDKDIEVKDPGSNYQATCKSCRDKDFIIDKLNKIIEQQQKLIDQINSVKKG
jgi:DNA-binding XRE family transcriptional regulator